MSNTPEEGGFLHDHAKELAIGSVAALGTIGLIFTIARQRLREQAEATPPDDETSNDNL